MANLQPLGSVPPGDLVAARHALHNAVQIIASFGGRLAEPKPDDSHRSMGWEPDLMAFRGVDLKPGFFVRMNPIEFRVELVGKGVSLDLADKPLTESLHALQEKAGLEKFDFAVFDETLPDQAFVQKPLTLPDLAHRTELALHYAHAYQALRKIAKEEDIRTWPHHFDIATIVKLEGDAQIGIGLSPGDGAYAEPYWYVTPWPLVENFQATTPPAPWRWHTEGWSGMVLRTSRLTGEPDLQTCLDVANRLIISA